MYVSPSFHSKAYAWVFLFSGSSRKDMPLNCAAFFFFLFFSFFHCFCIRFSLGVAHGSVASNLDSNKTFSSIYVARVVHVFCFFFIFVCVCVLVLARHVHSDIMHSHDCMFLLFVLFVFSCVFELPLLNVIFFFFICVGNDSCLFYISLPFSGACITTN